MTDKQRLLAEVLKLKMYLVSITDKHQLTVYTEDMLERINDIIKAVEENKD